MKVVILTLCEDHVYYGGFKAINSLKYFNPDYKIVRYGTKEIQDLKAKHNCDHLSFLTPCAIKDVWELEKPDLLIKYGADCLVFDRLDEILDIEFDVAAARNDSDIVGNRDERHNRPDIIREIPNWEWVNADFICIKSGKFVEAYHALTMDYYTGKVNALDSFGKFYKGDDQSSLNVVFKLGGFKTVILDPSGSRFVYGASGHWSGEKPPYKMPKSAIGNGNNNWPAWEHIYFDEKSGKCILPDNGIGVGDRIVKVLHQGGGFWPTKLGFDLFNEKFREYLRKITGFNE